MKRRHKRHDDEHESSERWLVSYADFITLLFAFFVVLYATSSQNVEKEKKFEESIREQMKLPISSGGGGTGGTGTGMSQASPAESDFAPSSPGNTSERAKLARSGEAQEKIEKALDGKLDGEEKKQISELRHDTFGVRMSLAASSVFPSGSAKLRRESLPLLGKLAQILKGSNLKMLIEGHTDDVPVAGGEYASNWDLASARATQVVRYLTTVERVPADRLAAVSYADQRPLVPNTSEENRAKNRRIEILVITGETPFDDPDK